MKPTSKDIENIDSAISDLSTEAIKFLQDIFHGIFEDYGYNQWRQVSFYKWDGLPPKRWWGLIIEIGDGDENEEHMVNLAIIRKGLLKVINNEVPINTSLQTIIKEASIELYAGQIDAEGADVILQAALFNEIRYG